MTGEHRRFLPTGNIGSVSDRTEFELRPFQRTDGSELWDALDANGHGHILGLQYAGSVEIWLSGYHTGAEENR